MIYYILLAFILLVAVVLTLFYLGRRVQAEKAQLSILMNQQDEMIRSLSRVERTFREEFSLFRDEISKGFKENREELGQSLKQNREELAMHLNRMTDLIENRLQSIQEDNNKKLEQMRMTVDEKLHKTLEARLGESFRLVSERLELVHRGLGEMQNLASGVGDLKKVLSNVKTRGVLGEYQLAQILEQILHRDQYDENISTKPNSRERVEFAVKLPGKENGELVYLPIDSKFPLEDYYTLVEAYEDVDPQRIDEALKALEQNIKRRAKEIRDKYVESPYTTDFAIMFLPLEGLYSELIRRTSLIDSLHREYRVMITGPATLAALLNSLQMGFKTLAIEKRSGEIWKVLNKVKEEFDKFGDVLKKAQDRIRQANEEIDTLVGTRTRKIQEVLKGMDQKSNDQIQSEDPLFQIKS